MYALQNVIVLLHSLRLDDEIMTVNNVSLGGVTHMQAVQALKDAGQHVTLVGDICAKK